MTLQDCSITPAQIAHIESQAYPEFMCGMEDCETWEDIASYCCVSTKHLRVYGKPGHWYCLATVHKKHIYVVDLACMPGRVPPIWTVIRCLLSLANGRPVECDARETTSYPLIKRLADRGRIQCTVSHRWHWATDTMVNCVIMEA